MKDYFEVEKPALGQCPHFGILGKWVKLSEAITLGGAYDGGELPQ